MCTCFPFLHSTCILTWPGMTMLWPCNAASRHFVQRAKEKRNRWRDPQYQGSHRDPVISGFACATDFRRGILLLGTDVDTLLTWVDLLTEIKFRVTVFFYTNTCKYGYIVWGLCVESLGQMWQWENCVFMELYSLSLQPEVPWPIIMAFYKCMKLWSDIWHNTCSTIYLTSLQVRHHGVRSQ